MDARTAEEIKPVVHEIYMRLIVERSKTLQPNQVLYYDFIAREALEAALTLHQTMWENAGCKEGPVEKGMRLNRAQRNGYTAAILDSDGYGFPPAPKDEEEAKAWHQGWYNAKLKEQQKQ